MLKNALSDIFKHFRDVSNAFRTQEYDFKGFPSIMSAFESKVKQIRISAKIVFNEVQFLAKWPKFDFSAQEVQKLCILPGGRQNLLKSVCNS